MNALKSFFALFAAAIFCLSGAVSASADNTHGLKTVVIDPGHGGKDPGAVGGKGKTIHEKHIVLSVSKLLGEKIKKEYPDVKVLYTRSDDKFIGLKDRAKVARNNNADLFISIHCNSNDNTSAKGTSVHILGSRSKKNKENKTDYFARNMSTAQRENAVIVMEDDYQTKYQTFDPDSPESYIGLQLQWQAFYQSSLLFAQEVIENLAVAPLQRRSVAVDQDIFQVLVDANMPAILLELAFISNPDEYKYLSSEDGQEEIAGRLFNAFKAYKKQYDASFQIDENVILANAVSKMEKINEEKKLAREYYAIQIMGLGRQLKANDPAFKGLAATGVKSETSNIYRYVYGKFTTFEAAKDELKAVQKKFPEAFVVYVNGDNVKRAK